MEANRSWMTRPVLIAGLLGGLLGGVASFAASRVIKPVAPERAAASGNPSEAREVGDAFIKKLEDGKFEEFALDAKMAAGASEEKYKAFKARFDQERILYAKLHGPSTHKFDFVRESIASPSLVRLVYLEKYETGGVLWFFVLYRTKDSWKIAFVDWNDNVSAIFGGMS